MMNRRDFVRLSTAGSGSLLFGNSLASSVAVAGEDAKPATSESIAANTSSGKRLPDLTPAQWIWYPSARSLANTFVLFRRGLQLSARPRRAVGWIAADSRYRLEVNGQHSVQWGPAPAIHAGPKPIRST